MEFNIADILKGHMKEVFNLEDLLSEQRIKICKECPLYKETSLGARCNSDLYLNPKTNETFDKPTEGAFKGCNCRLQAKSRIKGAECPAGKWEVNKQTTK